MALLCGGAGECSPSFVSAVPSYDLSYDLSHEPRGHRPSPPPSAPGGAPGGRCSSPVLMRSPETRGQPVVSSPEPESQQAPRGPPSAGGGTRHDVFIAHREPACTQGCGGRPPTPTPALGVSGSGCLLGSGRVSRSRSQSYWRSPASRLVPGPSGMSRVARRPVPAPGRAYRRRCAGRE